MYAWHFPGLRGDPATLVDQLSLLCPVVARRPVIEAGAERLEDESLESVTSKPGHLRAVQVAKGYQGKGPRFIPLFRQALEVQPPFALS